MPPEFTVPLGLASWQRHMDAVARVKQRVRRATAALDGVALPYAVIGGNAVAAWVESVEPEAVRVTPNVDLMFRRTELEAARTILLAVGLLLEQDGEFHLLRDGLQRSPRETGKVLIAGEFFRRDNWLPAPDITETIRLDGCLVPTFDALLRMKLTAFRTVDRMHLRDLMEVKLLDATWLDRLPVVLTDRLHEILNDPNG